MNSRKQKFKKKKRIMNSRKQKHKDPFELDRMLITEIMKCKAQGKPIDFTFKYTQKDKKQIRALEKGDLVERLCFVCKTVCKTKCGCCRFTTYCSKKCQKKDWVRHKSNCNKV